LAGNTSKPLSLYPKSLV